MGDLIDLARERRLRLLVEELARLSERMDQPAPPPETYGWIPVLHDDEGRAIRWLLPRWRAQIGYVAGAPERTFLDVNHELRAWDGLSIEELALGLETGTLPEPDVVLDWQGQVVEEP